MLTLLPNGTVSCPTCGREWDKESRRGDRDLHAGRRCPERSCDSHHTEQCNRAALDVFDSMCVCPGVTPGTARENAPFRAARKRLAA